MLLVRHAQSVWNVAGRWQGHADPPLTEAGEEQARTAADRAGGFDAVVSSDLERARRTAALLVPGQTPATEPDLREYHVGRWSGLTRIEIEATWPGELARFDCGQLETPPGGERRADFDARIQGALARLAGLWAGTGLDRALIVTHGGVIRAVARLHGWSETRVGHLCGYEAEVKGKAITLLRTVDLLDETVTAPGRGGEVAY